MTVFHWRLRDNKFPQVSNTFLNILTDLSNTVVWMVSTRPLISESSSPCTNTLVTVSKPPITIGITVTFMFHSFFHSLARSGYLYFFSVSLNFTLRSAGTAIFTILNVLFSFVVDYYYYYYYYYCSLIRAFHISDSRWFFTKVWVTASLLKSPGLLVFWKFSTMLSFGWSPLVCQPPSPLVPLVIP